MTTYSFQLEVSGTDVLAQKTLDELYMAGCSDATFGETDGRITADFDREAESFGYAVRSAISQIESVDDLRVRRVEEQDLVGIPDIAQRIGRSRQSVWQLANGERGAGDFPQPAARIGDDRSLWRWPDVAGWLARRGLVPEQSVERAHVVAAVNAFLEARDHIQQIARPRERLILARFAASDVLLVNLAELIDTDTWEAVLAESWEAVLAQASSEHTGTGTRTVATSTSVQIPEALGGSRVTRAA